MPYLLVRNLNTGKHFMKKRSMGTATVTSKGQITIPVDIRSALKLEAGDRVDFIIGESGQVVFTPVTKNIVSLKGIINRPDKRVSIHDMKATIKTRGGKL